MQPEFWHDRWQRNQIGFHQEQVNPCLERLWPQLELPRGARVLVPLCGKSLDLSWLAAIGWLLVFALWVRRHGAMYWQPRPDGQPG